MALWGTLDQADNAPKYTTTAADGNKGSDDFGTTVFGVDPAESQAARAAGTPVSHGWVHRTTGTGGRAGRVFQETLVAMSSQGSITSDAEDAAFPDYAISITTQPSDVAVTGNADAVFTVAAVTAPTGGTLAYQWEVSTNGGTSWVNSTAAGGTTSATLTVVSSDGDYVDTNQFRCVVSETTGTAGTNDVTSSAAVLSVS